MQRCYSSNPSRQFGRLSSEGKITETPHSTKIFMSLFSNFLFVFCDLVYLINLI